MGVFADWQPAYAEAGIATFPVNADEKLPRVKSYNRIGRKGSAQLASKFSDVDAFGFMCGPRNRLAMADIDEPCENLLADVLGKLGPSTVIARTASGNFHVWYRYNGEQRQLRCGLFPGRAIDILGGGYAVAPPSRSGSRRYEFLEGSLADLGALPKMLPVAETLTSPENVKAPGSDTAKVGERNKTLLAICGKAAPGCGSLDELVRYALETNEGGLWDALPEPEVARTARSAWKYQQEGCNGFAGDRFVQINRAAHDLLKVNPDALYLYQLCRAEHWGRDFLIANGWSKTLPLSLARLQKARQFLLDHDLIVCVRSETRNRPAVYRFSTLNGVMGGERGRGG